MLGWMDDEALARTLTTGRATYWSRSRQEYWVKGDTSGHVQWVKEVRLDCDGDTLLVKVDQVGAACHTGDRTCFDADLLRRWLTGARTFGPVVLLGLAARRTDRGRGQPAGAPRSAAAPAAAWSRTTRTCRPVTALGLVVLACWGVVLVTRGRVRRAVAGLGVAGRRRRSGRGRASRTPQVPDQLRDELAAVGVTDVGIDHTAWYWARAARRACWLAGGRPCSRSRWAPAWPEMGSRYDAPTAPVATSEAPPEEQSSLDLWKALDEGRDPTAADPE